LGRVHEHGTLLEAIVELRGDTSVAFVFVGHGHGFHRLREEAERRGLSNVVFKPLQPRERLAQSLALGDVHLVTLAPGMGRFVVPSKFYGVLAAGRPIVFVGDPESEIPAMLDAHECGFSVHAGDARGLAHTIRSLAQDPELRARLGQNARLMFEQRFAKRIALQAWRRVIEMTGGA
jgi:colanic acid biosynthesis glycosyl transferase WcaI